MIIKKRISKQADTICRKIKGTLFIRLLAYPYMTARLMLSQREYKHTEYPKMLRALAGTAPSGRCFIIGNGFSLRKEDLDAILSEFSIASNRIYKIFGQTAWRPTIYMAEDADGMKEMLPEILGAGIASYIISYKAKDLSIDFGNEKDKVIYGFWSNGKYIINRYDDKTSHISEDVSDHFSVGYTVTFSAIQLAIYMGFKEIYLLGVDFNYSVVADRKGRMTRLEGVQTYFDGKERVGSYLNYYSTIYAYSQAEEYCKAHGIKIYNATRGGKLEVFERVNFDEVVKKLHLNS